MSKLPRYSNVKALDMALTEESIHALVALADGQRVGLVSVCPASDGSFGRCNTYVDPRHDPKQTAFSKIAVLISGRELSLASRLQDHDILTAERLAAEVTDSQAEATDLIELAREHVRAIAARPGFAESLRALKHRIAASGGEVDLSGVEQPAAEPSGLPPMNFVIHLPEQPPPTVVVNVEPPPDKLVKFSRDYSGNITEATTEAL